MYLSGPHLEMVKYEIPISPSPYKASSPPSYLIINKSLVPKPLLIRAHVSLPLYDLPSQDSYPACVAKSTFVPRILPFLCREIDFRAKISTLPCAVKSTFLPRLLPCLCREINFRAKTPTLLVTRNQLSCQNLLSTYPNPNYAIPLKDLNPGRDTDI